FGPLNVRADKDRLSFLLKGNARPYALVIREGHDWRVRDVDRDVVASTWVRGDSFWILLNTSLRDEVVVAARAGFDGKTEVILQGDLSLSNARDITTDPVGVPHACFVTSRHEDATHLVYASRTGPRAKPWIVERIPMAGVYRCRIVANQEAVFIVAMANRGVLVLSRRHGSTAWATEHWGKEEQIAAARSSSGAIVIA